MVSSILTADDNDGREGGGKASDDREGVGGSA